MRLSLFGGGSDLFPGGRVISAAINPRIYVTQIYREHGWKLVYGGKVEEVDDPYAIEHDQIRNHVIRISEDPCEIHVHSELPDSAGLGSSSSVAVALALLAMRFHKNPYLMDVASYAWENEKIVHTVGWQDHYGAAHPGINYWFDVAGGIMRQPLPDWIEVFDRIQLWKAPVRTHGAAMVLKSYTQQGDMASIADRALVIGPKNIPALGALLNESWELKKAMSPHVSTPQIDHMIERLLNNGAVGAKLCGAGNGGFVMTLAEEPITKWLGYEEVPFEVNWKGANVTLCE